MQISHFAILAALLFGIGVYGILTRRNKIMLLMSVELILSAAIISLVAFGIVRDNSAASVFVALIVLVAVAEVAVGVAIGMLIYRNRRLASSMVAESQTSGMPGIKMLDDQ